VVALVSYALSAGGEGDDGRRLLVLVLVLVWGLRLGTYIARRNLGHGEDKRYTALMRRRTGNPVWWLVRRIYGMQATYLFVISIPVQLAMYESRALGWLDWLAVAVWAVGFLFEAVGDGQLSRFKADPANAGKVMDRGLWAWTRHPNYFGDATVWLGLWMLSWGHWAGLFAVFSPVLMWWCLVVAGGKRILEKGMRRSKGAAYDDYVARTSGFFPRGPRDLDRQDAG
jgi:steroid 5-alpha reductase family enzyme